MIAADVAAVHIEDQVTQKRCGHRPNKSLVDKIEMSDRIKAAVDGRTDESFFIMARTDSYATEGMNGAIDRCKNILKQEQTVIFRGCIKFRGLQAAERCITSSCSCKYY